MRAATTVLGLLLVIGWVDYLAGFWVSMQLFYLVPIVLSVAWFGWRAGCGFAVLAVLLRLAGDTAAGIFDQIDAGSVLWNRLVEACISFILVWLFHALFSFQRELEERVRQRTASLEQANAARQELQRQLAEAGRRERSAIGHDLHDGLGQHLTATSMAANVLASRLATAGHPEAERARQVVGLIQEGIAKTRRIARGLLLSAIEPDQLAAELEELAAGVRREHGVACQFTLRGRVDCDLATASHLFYIAQEAARNSLRHARPSRIELDLAINARELVLTVTDDGTGPSPTTTSGGGMGVRIMQHRSELIGGEFTVGPAQPNGTRVRCRIARHPADLPS